MSAENKKFFVTLIIALAVLGAGAALMKVGTTNQGTNPDLLRANDSTLSGSANAKVTITEFGDFQCPACAASVPALKEIAEKYGSDVSLVFRHFPLSQHVNAIPAALATESAKQQNKFWEMAELLYERQAEWEDLTDPTAKFIEYAKQLGLNEEIFRRGYSDPQSLELVKQDQADGLKLGVNQTPTFFINTQKFTGVPNQVFVKLIDDELSKM